MTAKLAVYWNIAVISPVCADQQFLDKKVCFNVYNEHTYFLKCTLLSVAEWLFSWPLEIQAYPTLRRVFGPFTKLGALFVEICKQFGWQRIGIIYDNKQSWAIPIEGIRYVIYLETERWKIYIYVHLL